MATQETAGTQGRAKPGRGGNIGLWIIQALLALGFAAAGLSKLLGAEMHVEMFEAIGLGQWLRYLTGALEVAGAIGLLIPLLSGLASLGLAAVMVGAVIADVFVLDAPPIASLTLLVLSLVVAWGRRGNTAALLNGGSRAR